jgi:hypothetical protein
MWVILQGTFQKMTSYPQWFFTIHYELQKSYLLKKFSKICSFFENVTKKSYTVWAQRALKVALALTKTPRSRSRSARERGKVGRSRSLRSRARALMSARSSSLVHNPYTELHAL